MSAVWCDGATQAERRPLGPCAATRSQTTLTRPIPVQPLVMVNTAASLTAKDMSSARFSMSRPSPCHSRTITVAFPDIVAVRDTVAKAGGVTGTGKWSARGLPDVHAAHAGTRGA
jgi:hypothetical protein